MKRFESVQQRLDIIESFKQFALGIKSDNPSDKEIKFETITEWDEDSNEKGQISVIYIQQPALISAVQLFDMVQSKGLFQTGYHAWDLLVRKESDNIPDRMKLSLCPRLVTTINATPADIKKN